MDKLDVCITALNPVLQAIIPYSEESLSISRKTADNNVLRNRVLEYSLQNKWALVIKNNSLYYLYHCNNTCDLLHEREIDDPEILFPQYIDKETLAALCTERRKHSGPIAAVCSPSRSWLLSRLSNK